MSKILTLSEAEEQSKDFYLEMMHNKINDIILNKVCLFDYIKDFDFEITGVRSDLVIALKKEIEGIKDYSCEILESKVVPNSNIRSKMILRITIK